MNYSPMLRVERPMDGRHSPRPLARKTIVVTRAGAQARELRDHVEELGGIVVDFPTIEIRPPENFAAFDAAVAEIGRYHWLIFTSVNAVDPFMSRLQRGGKTTAALSGLKIAAIGPETAKKLAAAGIGAQLVPERYQAEGLLETVTPEMMRDKRVLIPRAAEAREILPDTLRRWGAAVEVVIAYQTALPQIDPAPLIELLRRNAVDVITFTSSSTVRNFLRLLGKKSFGEVAGGSLLACIGPITAETVTHLGGRADIVATEFTVAGLIRMIVDHFRSKPESTDRSFGGGTI
jgi:uroporphyrinogen III methyltransferase/synthase